MNEIGTTFRRGLGEMRAFREPQTAAAPAHEFRAAEFLLFADLPAQQRPSAADGGRTTRVGRTSADSPYRGHGARLAGAGATSLRLQDGALAACHRDGEEVRSR